MVTIRPQTKDRYGRTVAEVFRNGRAVNLAMVQSGQAFAYRKYLSACDRGSYLAAVAQAKQSRRGVWAVSGGDRTFMVLAPWAQQSHVLKARPAPGSGIPGPVHVPVAPVAAPAGYR